MNGWMKMNKRGMIIAKNEIYQFDETKDHLDNLKDIIDLYYPEYVDIKDSLFIFSAAVAITNSDDITIIRPNEMQVQVYLPESIDILTEFQRIELTRLLNNDMDFVLSSFPKQDNLFNPIIDYKKDELLAHLTQSMHIK